VKEQRKMATPTVLIVCPECSKQIKAPEHVFGKKVRCKFCQAAFVAKPGTGKTAPGKAEKKPAGKPSKAPAAKPEPAKPAKPDDDEDDANPYGMVDVDLSARCPNCANEMESEDAIVCLICGYNTLTREQHKTRKTYDNTVGDQVAWLLPGIICVLVIVATLIFDIWYLMKIDDILGNEDSWYLSMWSHHGIKTWVIIVSLFIIFFTGRFAIKRLLIHYARPEVEKTK
jgi:DNA-directed RNA polymerase subunit RPC12/RpoP